MRLLRFILTVSSMLLLSAFSLMAQSGRGKMIQSDNSETTLYSSIAALEELSQQLQVELDNLRSIYKQQQSYKAFAKMLDLSPTTFESEVQLHNLTEFSHHEDDFISFSKFVLDSELKRKALAYAVLAKSLTVFDERLVSIKEADDLCEELSKAYPEVYKKHQKDAEEVYIQMMNYVYCIYQLEYLFKMIDDEQTVLEDNSRLREVRPIKVLYNYFTEYSKDSSKRSEIRAAFRKVYPDLSF